jgi:hypothetical protein
VRGFGGQLDALGVDRRQAELVSVEEGLQVPVGQPDLLAPDPLGTEVRVPGAEVRCSAASASCRSGYALNPGSIRPGRAASAL